MKEVVFSVVLLLCLSSAQGYWELIGFENDNVSCIAQHPQDTTIMLVSIADSIYRSSDGGHTWPHVVGFSLLPINCLAFDAVYGDTVYALIGNGSYSDGIYRSTDAGITWSVLEWFIVPLSMTIPDYPSGLIVVGCDSAGIFKSEDGGDSWEAWNDGLTDFHIEALDYCNPFDSLPIFFAGTAHGLFFWSLGLDEWSQANGIPTYLRVSSVAYNKINEFGFATVTGGSWSDGIYRSTDFGINWQVVNWWIYPSCVAMNPQWWSPSDTLSVFAGDSGLGVQRSTDCGTNWHETNTGLDNLYINSLSYHYQDTLRLFCSTQEGLYRYVYETPVAEKITHVRGNSLEIHANFVRAGEPIPIKSNTKVSCELTIVDAAGRRVRTDRVAENTTFLKPLEKSGIYFIISSGEKYYCRKKLIVVD